MGELSNEVESYGKNSTGLNNSNAHTLGQGWLLVMTHCNHRELHTQDS